MNKQALSIRDVTGTSTISFSTKELLDLFGLPDMSPEDMYYMDYWPSDEDLLGTTSLDISWDDEQEVWLDKTGAPLKEEVIDEIKTAIIYAMESQTMANYTKRVQGALEEILDIFANFEYEYDFINETGSYEGMQGTATGITNVMIDYDTTTITTDNDLVHVINTCITGVGLFNVDEELEGDEYFADYIQSRFHWLKSYWEIFGTRMPQPDLEHIEDFDGNYFKDLLKDIEKTFNVSIT